MQTETVNGYRIAGNYHIAIAINVDDPTDAHYFEPQEKIKWGADFIPDMGAYDCALVWTSPGI